MSAPRPASNPLTFAAVVLVVLGFGLWGLYRFVASGGPHAYAPGAQAPYSVTLDEGSVYRIAVPGGRAAITGLGLTPETLRCSAVSTDGGTQALTLTADSTKATDQLAYFVSPVAGRVHVECSGLVQVFVAGNDEPFDTAGLLLVLATIALAVGIPLLLSVLRSRPAPAPPAALPPPAFAEPEDA